MAAVPFLDAASEDALHKSRLYNTDEKAFRRVAKSILSSDSVLTHNGQLPPAPPPSKKQKTGKSDAKKAEDEKPEKPRNAKEELQQMRDTVLTDFANFESNLIRMQFLLKSNEQERARYAEEKIRIQTSAQEVRNSTTELRERLDIAQKQLALRKEYDALAEKITSNRLLKPREEQRANIGKLNAEIAELERESKEYAATWAERREQFGKIIEEGMQLRRLIRDEKEEVERREGMEGNDEHDDADGMSTRGRISAVGTPHPEAGGATPLHPTSEPDSNTLAPDRYAARGKSPFRATSPIPEEGTPKPATDIDDRADEGEASADEGGSSGSEGLVEEDGEIGSEEGPADDDDEREVADPMDTA